MDKVYIGNLPPDIRIKDINDFFQPFGRLLYVDINHRSNPVYALVQFDSPRNAFMAVKSRHGYNYRGYTLQLKMAENEVRKRRDATPPPPPPSMFNNYGTQGNRGGSGNNYSSFSSNRMGQSYSNSSASSFQSSQWGSFDNYNIKSRSNLSQYSSDNRMNTGQQNMMDYSSNNRSNMSYSSSGRSDMSQENKWDYFPNDRSNMSYSLNDRSNMTQQNMNYSTSNRSNMSYPSNDRSSISQQSMNYSSNNMSQQNMNYSSNNMSQQNMMYSSNNMSQQNMNYSPNNMSQQNMNYSSNNRSNMSYSSNERSVMPHQNMNFSNADQANMNYSNSNLGNNDLGGSNNFVYNASEDPYANASFQDNYTRGLSGAGRKWFNRYIREGYSAERARAKALERRTVPYLRDDPRGKPVDNDPTNAALENIGTTIISLLSNTAVDNLGSGNEIMPSYSNWGGDNYQAGIDSDMPGPSRGRGEPRNAVSKQQYLKSLNILNRLRSTRSSRSARDRLSKKYHTQIVNDYERYQRMSGGERRERDNQVSTPSSEGKSYTQLLVAYKKKKQHLLITARKMGNDKNNRTSGAFRKRMRFLITEGGFQEIEAKALAVHRLSQLRILMQMKFDYEAALKKKQEKFAPIKQTDNQKGSSYDADIKYLKNYEKYRVENLGSRIKVLLRDCIDRIHKYEKKNDLPLTKTKFTRFLSRDRGRRRRRGRRSNRGSKRDGEKSKAKNQDNEKDRANAKKENVDNDVSIKEESQDGEDNKNITEDQHDDCKDVENVKQDE